MAFYKDERVALFIDGANLYSTMKSLGVEIDYRKLLDEFRRRGRLVRALYYTALIENDDYSPIRPLVDWLQYNGYSLVTKPAKEFTDANGRRRVKGDMDVEIAVDMLELAPRIDHAVLFTGDGDLTRAVQATQQRGVRVSVASTVRAQQSMIADELRRAADNFIELAELAELVARPPRPGGAPGWSEGGRSPVRDARAGAIGDADDDDDDRDDGDDEE
jgi:uncharacterized LabA/DUF88 family protein